MSSSACWRKACSAWDRLLAPAARQHVFAAICPVADVPGQRAGSKIRAERRSRSWLRYWTAKKRQKWTGFCRQYQIQLEASTVTAYSDHCCGQRGSSRRKSLPRRLRRGEVMSEQDEQAWRTAWQEGATQANKQYVRRRISIDPTTRLEGHGKIEILLDEAGEVDRAYLQVP